MTDDEEKSKPQGESGSEKESQAKTPIFEGTGDEVEYETVAQEEPVGKKDGAKTDLKLQLEQEKGHKAKLKKKDLEIKALRKENEELRDKYLRSLAEMENLRKRMERERQEFQKFALADFLRELLVVLDNFERALRTEDQVDGKSLREGIEMIYRQYLDLLKKKGVRPIDSEDRKFDPTIHQAVLTEESEGVTEPEVGEVLQRGFWLEDRLLRPAMVKVRIPAKKDKEES